MPTRGASQSDSGPAHSPSSLQMVWISSAVNLLRPSESRRSIRLSYGFARLPWSTARRAGPRQIAHSVS